MVRLLGIDPGLRFTGWGLIEVHGNRLSHLADGVIATDGEQPLSVRLRALHDALGALIGRHAPDEAAIEETYVNRNGAATLKLGYARGVALLAPALAGIPVIEYGAKAVKKAVVGTGGADKAAGAGHGPPPAARRGDRAGGRGGRARGRDLPRASSRQPARLGGRRPLRMIGRLTGRVDGIEDGRCIVDVNGVGYLIHASTRTLSARRARARA